MTWRETDDPSEILAALRRGERVEANPGESESWVPLGPTAPFWVGDPDCWEYPWRFRIEVPDAPSPDDDCATNYCHNGLHHVQAGPDDYHSWPCPKYAAKAAAFYERHRDEPDAPSLPPGVVATWKAQAKDCPALVDAGWTVRWIELGDPVSDADLAAHADILPDEWFEVCPPEGER